MKKSELRKLRPKMQLIFQDPYASLDSRMTVGNIIGEALIDHKMVSKADLRARVLEEGKNRGWTTFLPEFKFTTDNAAMIAIAGHYHYLDGKRTSLAIAPVSRLADF